MAPEKYIVKSPVIYNSGIIASTVVMLQGHFEKLKPTNYPLGVENGLKLLSGVRATKKLFLIPIIDSLIVVFLSPIVS